MGHRHSESELLPIFVHGVVLLFFLFAIVVVSPRSSAPGPKVKNMRGARLEARYRAPEGPTLEPYAEAKIGKMNQPDFLAVGVECCPKTEWFGRTGRFPCTLAPGGH